jgi:hypothetical protein
MYAVIFEVEPEAGREQDYLDIAARLRPELEKIDGFISIEPEPRRQDPVIVVLARRGSDRALAPTGATPGGATRGPRRDLSRLPDPRRRRDARLRYARTCASAAVDAAKIQAGLKSRHSQAMRGALPSFAGPRARAASEAGSEAPANPRPTTLRPAGSPLNVLFSRERRCSFYR